jgi:TetR/AcrR family transcriptional repressor of mexJK operon
MESIAAEARVTKVTIYRHFENKEALFSAALEAFLDELPVTVSVVSNGRVSLRARLIELARNVLALGTGPLILRFHRMLSVVRDSTATTAEGMWEANFERYHDAVAQVLRAEQKRGALELADARIATTHFLSLIAGEPMVRLFLTGVAFGDNADADTHVRAAVDVFLRAYDSGRGLSGALDQALV